MTDPTTPRPLTGESVELLTDIHVIYCTRSAPAMSKHTPQGTAHQVEGLVMDRLTAIEAAAHARAIAGEADRWAKYIRLAMVAADWFRHDVDTYPGSGKPFYVYTRPDDNRLVRLRDALIECGEDITHQEPDR